MMLHKTLPDTAEQPALPRKNSRLQQAFTSSCGMRHVLMETGGARSNDAPGQRTASCPSEDEPTCGVTRDRTRAQRRIVNYVCGRSALAGCGRNRNAQRFAACRTASVSLSAPSLPKNAGADSGIVGSRVPYRRGAPRPDPNMPLTLRTLPENGFDPAPIPKVVLKDPELRRVIEQFAVPPRFTRITMKELMLLVKSSKKIIRSKIRGGISRGTLSFVCTLCLQRLHPELRLSDILKAARLGEKAYMSFLSNKNTVTCPIPKYKNPKTLSAIREILSVRSDCALYDLNLMLLEIYGIRLSISRLSIILHGLGLHVKGTRNTRLLDREADTGLLRRLRRDTDMRSSEERRNACRKAFSCCRMARMIMKHAKYRSRAESKNKKETTAQRNSYIEARLHPEGCFNPLD